MKDEKRNRKNLEEEMLEELEEDFEKEEEWEEAKDEVEERDLREISQKKVFEEEDYYEEDDSEKESKEEVNKRGFLKKFGEGGILKKLVIVLSITFLIALVGVAGITFFLEGKSLKTKKLDEQFSQFQSFNQTTQVEQVSNQTESGVIIQGQANNATSTSSSGVGASLSDVSFLSNDQKAQVSKESEGIAQKGSISKGSEDVFLTFFRTSSEKEKSKKAKTSSPPLSLESSLPPAPSIPLFAMPSVSGGLGETSFDKVRIYGIVCDATGRVCYAETNLGRLGAGDTISRGTEKILSITKDCIKTNLRIISF